MHLTNSCKFCKSSEIVKIDTYKYVWHICPNCGSASSRKKDYHPLVKNFPFDMLTSKTIERKEELVSMLFGNQNVLEDNSSIYDYFTSDFHIKYSIESTKPFLKNIIDRYNIDIKGKQILDISGGNGHFINEFKKLGADVSMTEFNKKAVDYVNTILNINAYLFDFNKDDIGMKIPSQKFDIIFLRAAVMFCVDLKSFLQQLKPLLNKNAIIIYSQSVLPTLGVMMRTQFDEYNYQYLYQPKILQDIHKKEGYSLIASDSDPDQDMYIYDLDKFTILREMICEYERKALTQLPSRTNFSFRARDRRRYSFIFEVSN